MEVKHGQQEEPMRAEMRFLRRTAGYTHWDHKSNEDILTELQISDNRLHISV
jgi:hypothetical protein